MKPDEFYTSLINNLEFEATDGQALLFRAFVKFIFSQKNRVTLIVQGYAGTGKTTSIGVITSLINKVNWKTVLLAPTGRAAKVLSLHSKKPASTIHKKIYHKQTSKEGGVFFARQQNLHKNTLFIVDECSMIGMHDSDNSSGSSLLDDLINYVFSGQNCKLMFIGDGAQLPPVGSNESPALDVHFLNDRYNLTVGKIELKDVVRQKSDSGILMNATSLRNMIPTAKPGQFPQLSVADFTDIEQLSGTDVREYIEDAYSKYGLEQTIIITRSNKRANYFNGHIRSQILWHDDEICSGDKVMVVRNNYFWLEDLEESSTDFIANGDILEVISVRNFVERYDLNFVDATVKLKDYPEMPEFEVKFILDAIYEDGPSLNSEKSKNLFQEVSNDYLDLGTKKKIKEAVMKDPFYNALQIKYAYALTCHKSQGGQWPVVMIDQGYLTEEMLGAEYLRWLYTAMTRATDHLFLLSFNEQFFE